MYVEFVFVFNSLYVRPTDLAVTRVELDSVCNNDHYLVVTKVREILSECKVATYVLIWGDSI
jgi:hypothetical protein